MTTYNKPDLNAPRFRPKKHNILNKAFYKDLIAKYPELSKYPYEQVKKVINTFHGAIWDTAINYRDGIELPEQIGYIFIGTCPRKSGDNPDRKASTELGVKVQYKNWESDNYTAKIFYTNYETKYKFRYHELWGFKALKEFRATVGKAYPQNWKSYVVVDNYRKISRFFRFEIYKDILKEETNKGLEAYNEFDL